MKHIKLITFMLSVMMACVACAAPPIESAVHKTPPLETMLPQAPVVPMPSALPTPSETAIPQSTSKPSLQLPEGPWKEVELTYKEKTAIELLIGFLGPGGINFDGSVRQDDEFYQKIIYYYCNFAYLMDRPLGSKAIIPADITDIYNDYGVSLTIEQLNELFISFFGKRFADNVEDIFAGQKTEQGIYGFEAGDPADPVIFFISAQENPDGKIHVQVSSCWTHVDMGDLDVVEAILVRNTNSAFGFSIESCAQKSLLLRRERGLDWMEFAMMAMGPALSQIPSYSQETRQKNEFYHLTVLTYLNLVAESVSVDSRLLEPAIVHEGDNVFYKLTSEQLGEIFVNLFGTTHASAYADIFESYYQENNQYIFENMESSYLDCRILEGRIYKNGNVELNIYISLSDRDVSYIPIFAPSPEAVSGYVLQSCVNDG